jgi:hypothetical protein
MKKIGYLSLSLMLIALVAGSAVAEMPAGFNLSGSIDINDTYRSQEVNTFLNGCLTTSDFVMYPIVNIDTRFDLKSKVTGFIRFGNFGGAIDEGTYANSEFGSGLNIQPMIKQAYIKVNEFISPKLAMTYGIQDLNFTLRKNEGAFFMHPAAALSPLDVGASFDQDMATRTPRIRGLAEYSGFVFDFGSMKDDNYAVNVFWGKTMESVVVPGTAGTVGSVISGTPGTVVLPAPAVSGKRNEDLLFGANLTYKLPGDNNVAKAILAQMSNSVNGMSIMTIGVGVDYFGAMPNLEIYGEAYMQSGTLSNAGFAAGADGKLFTADDLAKDVDQSAMAYRLGGKYDFANNPLKPWVGLSYWFVDGGDDSLLYKNKSLKYTENNHFVSFEDTQSTMILEDNLYGLNLNTNYTAIKIEAGITTSLTLGGEKSDLDLNFLLGSFTMNTVPYVWNAGPDGYLGTKDDIDATTGYPLLTKTKAGLGTEIDIVAKLHYTENLSFKLGLGMLSGSNFLKSIDVNNANNGKYNQNFDSMTMVTLGADLKF